MPADVVLLHGFTQSRRSWDGVRDRLDAARYRVLTPDLRGHGTAAERRPADFASVRGDLDALIPGGAVLAGYSMGGRIALDWALHHPGRLAGLVLIGASPGLADPAERDARLQADLALADRIEAIGVESFAGEWGALPLWAGQPPEVAAAARADRLSQSAAGLAAALRGLGTGAMEPLWDRLAELELPVTLVVGEHDAKFRAIAARMAALLPDVRMSVVAGAGHAAALEAPAFVAEALGRLSDRGTGADH